MATVELTKENLTDIIENNEIVMIDFFATWCEPCKSFEPIFEKASEKHPDITFGKVDIEAQAEVAGAFGIKAVPTFMVFRDQIGLLSESGVLAEETLESVIKQVKELDMDEIREELAKHEAEHNHGCGCSCGKNGEE